MARAATRSARGGGVLANTFVQHSGLAGLMLILLSVPGYIVAETWFGLMATKRAWTITGPPCPVVVAPARSVVGSKAPRDFTYNGAIFARHFGHVSCVAFREDGLFASGSYSVCQFSGPGAVHVTAGGRTVVFQPGVGRPATVTVRRGEASCVVAGWFRY